MDFLANLLRTNNQSTFDLIFLDADKEDNLPYYESALELLRQNGVCLIDNTLWSGKILDDSVQDADTNHIRALNDFLVTDERVHYSQLTIGDGLAMCVKK
jgi:predicted O-methyltransferase YrrM